MFGYLYVEVTAYMTGCKINHFDTINMHSLIHSIIVSSSPGRRQPAHRRAAIQLGCK
jgi:hypothetical protein